MKNAIIEKHTVTAAFAPLSATSLRATVEIACDADNSGAVTFRVGDAGTEVALAAGASRWFFDVDLSTIQVSGTADDVVTIIGVAGPV